MKKIIQTKSAPAAIGPYSQAVMAGDFLFTSGQIALDALTGELIDGGVAEQTKKVMDNLSAVLATANMNFDNVVKVNIYIMDMNDFGIINEIYGEYFDANPPARATVEVSRLPKDVLVEIDCVAYNG